MKRNVITIAIIVAALAIVYAMWRSGADNAPTAITDITQNSPQTDQTPEAGAQTTAQSPSDTATATATTPPAPPTDTAAPQPAPSTQTAAISPLPSLRVRPLTETQPEPVLGSTDPATNFRTQATLTPWGAGLKTLELTDYNARVADDQAKYLIQQALVVLPDDPSTPADDTRYRYPLAVYAAVINGTPVELWSARWQYLPDASTPDRSATFQVTIEDENANPIATIQRTWSLEPQRYDLHISHNITNLTDQPLRVTLSHYGPGDMPHGGGYLGDRRHVIVGHLIPSSSSDPTRKRLTTSGYNQFRENVIESTSAFVWPGTDPPENADLVWVALDNRYFTAALHGIVNRDTLDQITTGQLWADAALTRQYNTIRRVAWGGPDKDNRKLMLLMDARPVTLQPADQPNASRTIELDLYAGPKEPTILEDDPVYSALQLDDLIVYNLGGICAFFTFAWLADLLIGFLSLIASLVHDWGAAIIILVLVVRTILHPLTKNAQLSMMKLSRQMQAIQPEVERLKEKHKDDSTRQQSEMLKLYREKGVNPASGALGCLPMFLQMPIWVALYATLYYAIELRHEPAFWGVFQKISDGAWPFLADLSSQDHFIPLGNGFNIPFVDWHVDAINILPILMAAVFYIQQKYMTAQSPNMSEQQRTQQKMMKFMMLLFPIFLYKAPSGLTLYMVTSSAIGIVESRRVRKHLKDLEAAGELDKPKSRKPPKPGGIMDRISKVVEERQKMMEKQQKAVNKQNKPRK